MRAVEVALASMIVEMKNPPRAVALILGHLGATRESLQGYSQLYYSNEEYCSVVTATSPVRRFLLNQSVRPTARLVLQQAHAAIQNTPDSVPIVVHVLSNGGAFLLEEKEQILLEQQQDEQDSFDKKLIASRMKLGFQFFDSSDWRGIGSI
jgi:Eukaryotic protein of unknown function (DUF829)